MNKNTHSIQAFSIMIVLVLTLSACGTKNKTPTVPAPTYQTIIGQIPTSTKAHPLPTNTVTQAPPSPTVTATQTQQPTHTPPIPTSTPPIFTATALPMAAPLAILSFSVDSQDIPEGGKRFTYQWTTSGATSVTIYSGAQMRFPKFWPSLPPNGTYTADITYTYYRNPSMSLTAYDYVGNQVSKRMTVTWPCKHSYFFTPEPVTCPAFDAVYTAAAEELFEKGRMIWLQEIRIGDYQINNQILVLFETGDMAHYDDTWTESEPDRDPSIVPPDGFFQPIRGFGKLWRTDAKVRNGLGWAIGEEIGYQAAIQQQAHEAIAGPLYIRTSNEQIIELPSGWPSGRWKIYLPYM